MNHTMKAKNWIMLFLAGVLAMLAMLAGVAYAVDPYFQYRVKDYTYFLCAPFVNAGLIKNYDYDTLIVGSCMMGNFDMEQFRKALGKNPLKAESGGMPPMEIAEYLRMAADVGKADTYYATLDLDYFVRDMKSGAKEYLIREDFLSRCRYFLGYETWFRFIPVDFGLLLLKQYRGEFTGKFAQRTSIDCNGEWNLDFSFGEGYVYEDYLRERPSGQQENTDELYEVMTVQIDRFVSQIDFQTGEYNFFFPPYSVLFWCEAQDEGRFDAYLMAKAYLIERLTEAGGTVYDFQAADFITDLNKYMDSMHYSAEVNAFMTECFARRDYLVTPENCEAFSVRLIEIIDSFRGEHAALLER